MIHLREVNPNNFTSSLVAVGNSAEELMDDLIQKRFPLCNFIWVCEKTMRLANIYGTVYYICHGDGLKAKVTYHYSMKMLVDEYEEFLRSGKVVIKLE